MTGLYLIKQVNLLLIQLIPSKLNRSLVQCTSHYEVSYYYLETLYLQPHKWKETERKKTEADEDITTVTECTHRRGKGDLEIRAI